MLALACSSTAEEPARDEGPAQTVAFAGGDLDVATLAERDDARTLAVHEPYEDRRVRFEVVPAGPVLDAHLPRWRDAEELVFVCADGYRAGVPVSRLLRHEPHLAFAREGGDFAIDKPVGGEVERVPLAPAYLVWENLEDPVVRAEGDWGWPYQIVGVEIADLDARYGGMTVPDHASEDARRGFVAFRRYCARCHAINGQGGDVGPELNYPASVTEYVDARWLRRWILEPLSVRHGTPMPGLPRGVPDRDAVAEDLVAYLDAMAERKLAPPDAD